MTWQHLAADPARLNDNTRRVLELATEALGRSETPSPSAIARSLGLSPSGVEGMLRRLRVQGLIPTNDPGEAARVSRAEEDVLKAAEVLLAMGIFPSHDKLHERLKGITRRDVVSARDSLVKRGLLNLPVGARRARKAEPEHSGSYCPAVHGPCWREIRDFKRAWKRIRRLQYQDVQRIGA